MDFPALKAALAELNAKRDAQAKRFTEAGPDLNMDLITSLSGDSKSKVEQLQAFNDEINKLKADVDGLREVGKAAENVQADPELEEGPEVALVTQTFGEMFVNSAAYKSFSGTIGPVATLGPNLDIRNTLFKTTAGWAPESTRTGIVTMFPTRPAPHVVDFIPTLPTSQSSVKFMEETTFTNAAVEKAEGTAFAEAALVLTERSITVEKIPVFLPVTDEQLEDEQAVSGYIDQRLVFMIQQRLDLQVLGGDGSTPNLRGTENVSSIQVQALGGDSIPDAIYKLFRKIRDNGFGEPTVVFIAPAKWETVRLLRTADGIYIWGHPSTAGPTVIWGVPVVETTAVTSTKAIAGDYLMHSNLYVRRGIDVQISNSHASFFIEGKQAIRADLRVAMVHYRAKAFGEVTGL